MHLLNWTASDVITRTVVTSKQLNFFYFVYMVYVVYICSVCSMYMVYVVYICSVRIMICKI